MSTRQSTHRPRVHNLEYERQKHLILRPVQTWERAWVAPKNDDGSSTAKILKWVKSEKLHSFDSDSEASDDEGVMTSTPGMETPDMMNITTPQTPLTLPNSNVNTPIPHTNAIATPGAEVDGDGVGDVEVDEEDIENIENIEAEEGEGEGEGEGDVVGEESVELDPSSTLLTPVTVPTPLNISGNVLTVLPEDPIASEAVPLAEDIDGSNP